MITGLMNAIVHVVRSRVCVCVDRGKVVLWFLYCYSYRVDFAPSHVHMHTCHRYHANWEGHQPQSRDSHMM